MSERAEKKQQKNVAFSKHSDKDNDGINNDKDNDIADIMVKKIMKNIMIVLIMIKIMTQLISRAHCHCISRRKKQQRKVASSKHGDKNNEKDNYCIYNDKDNET